VAIGSLHERDIVQKPKKVPQGRPGFNSRGEPITTGVSVAVRTSISLIEHYITPNNKALKGRWTETEHNKFLEAIRLYGKDWRKVQEFIGTRSGA
jgi:SHAQKYF class myb-like DNA-binding protein